MGFLFQWHYFKNSTLMVLLKRVEKYLLQHLLTLNGANLCQYSSETWENFSANKGFKAQKNWQTQGCHVCTLSFSRIIRCTSFASELEKLLPKSESHFVCPNSKKDFKPISCFLFTFGLFKSREIKENSNWNRERSQQSMKKWSNDFSLQDDIFSNRSHLKPHNSNQNLMTRIFCHHVKVNHLKIMKKAKIPDQTSQRNGVRIPLWYFF